MSYRWGLSASASPPGWTRSPSSACISARWCRRDRVRVDQAERVRTRLLSQVDERRNPRTRATVGQPLDRWLQVLDVDLFTRRAYVSKIDKHIQPLLGSLSLTRLDVEACRLVLRRAAPVS
jgi:hypothetical protein